MPVLEKHVPLAVIKTRGATIYIPLATKRDEELLKGLLELLREENKENQYKG